MRTAHTWILAGLLALGPLPGAAFAEQQTYTNSVGMEFALIPAAGRYVLGCGTPGCGMDKLLTSIPRPYYMGKHEVTQAQWQAVMGNNPSVNKGPDRPVDSVSWNDAQNFVRKLNAKEGHNRYRLPTQVEWEYADRAGRDAEYCRKGDNPLTDKAHAWYGEQLKGGSHPVGKKEPNAWGLHDMHGNVDEWVQDNYGEEGGLSRMRRGGHWFNPPGSCGPAYSSGGEAKEGSEFVGFRVVLDVGK